MKVQGIIIYHYYGRYHELVHLDNFKKIDYISITDIGSVGYKIYNSSNINSADSLILHCKLDFDFAKKLDFSQQRDTLDRLLRALSNMTPNTTLVSPSDYFDTLKLNKGNDFFSLEENLYCKPATSMLNSD